MTGVVGIDLGTRKVSMAIYTEGSSGFTLYEAVSHEPDIDSTRSAILEELSRFVSNRVMLVQVGSIWVEDVIVGNNRKYSVMLGQVLGAVLSGLALVERLQGTDVRRVDNKTWKKELLGNGNATKEQIRDYIIDTHPTYAAFCGEDQDLYDASCIGLYGITITQRASQLQL